MNTEALIRFFKQYPFAIIFGLISAVLLVFIMMRQDRLPVLEEQLAGIERELETFERNQRRAIEVETHVAEMEELRAAVEARLMSTSVADLPRRIQFLLTLFEASSVTGPPPGRGSLLTPGRDVPITTQAIPQLSYSQTVDGSLDEALALLDNIRQSRHFMVTDAVTLTPIGNPVDRRVRMQFTFRVLARVPTP